MGKIATTTFHSEPAEKTVTRSREKTPSLLEAENRDKLMSRNRGDL
jgi:hypothetical protein